MVYGNGWLLQRTGSLQTESQSRMLWVGSLYGQRMMSTLGVPVWYNVNPRNDGWYQRHSLQWRHNERDGISNHRRLDCLLNHLIGADQRKYQNSASLAFVREIHRWTVNSLHKGPLTWKKFPFDDIIISDWCQLHMYPNLPCLNDIDLSVFAIWVDELNVVIILSCCGLLSGQYLAKQYVALSVYIAVIFLGRFHERHGVSFLSAKSVWSCNIITVVLCVLSSYRSPLYIESLYYMAPNY